MKWMTRMALLAVVVTTVGCDQVSKHLATTHLRNSPPRSYLHDSVRLEYAENTGAFLSLGAGLRPEVRSLLSSAGTGVFLFACVFLALRRRWPPVRVLGMSLLFAGGLSNLIDRVVQGTVVDFLNVGIGPLRTGIFNVADMAVVLGLVLFVFGRALGAPASGSADPLAAAGDGLLPP